MTTGLSKWKSCSISSAEVIPAGIMAKVLISIDEWRSSGRLALYLDCWTLHQWAFSLMCQCCWHCCQCLCILLKASCSWKPATSSLVHNRWECPSQARQSLCTCSLFYCWLVWNCLTWQCNLPLSSLWSGQDHLMLPHVKMLSSVSLSCSCLIESGLSWRDDIARLSFERLRLFMDMVKCLLLKCHFLL